MDITWFILRLFSTLTSSKEHSIFCKKPGFLIQDFSFSISCLKKWYKFNHPKYSVIHVFKNYWLINNIYHLFNKLLFFHKIFLKKFDMLKNDKLITTFLKKRKICTLLWNSSWIHNDMVIKFRQSYQFFRMLYITFFLSQKYFIVSTSLKVSIFFLHWVSRLILSEKRGFFYYYQISVKPNQVLPQFLKT